MFTNKILVMPPDLRPVDLDKNTNKVVFINNRFLNFKILFTDFFVTRLN